MNIDLAAWGLGVVSLFPLVGRIEKLRGFFPPRLRDWFVSLSTVFSLITFLVLQFRFSSLSFLIPTWMSAATAGLFLIAYLFCHLALKPAYGRLRGWRYALVIASLLLLYVGAIHMLTYTFNTLNQLRHFQYYRGTVKVEGSRNVPAHAEVIFDLVAGDSVKITSSEAGTFQRIVARGNLSSITINVPDTTNKVYCRTWSAEELPDTDDVMHLEVKRCSGT